MTDLKWRTSTPVKQVNSNEQFELKEGDKVYLAGVLVNVEVSKTPKTGLSKTKSLCSNCGMVFFFPDGVAHITMKDTALPLDIIFIDQNEIVKIIEAEGMGDDYMYNADCVIELNKGFCRDNNINIGAYLEVRKEVSSEEKLEHQQTIARDARRLLRHKSGGSTFKPVTKKQKKKTLYLKGRADGGLQGVSFQSPGSREVEKKFKNAPMAKYQEGSKLEDLSKSEGMYLLDEKGQVQMVLQGEERIFSRIHTRKILDFIKKIDETKDPQKIEDLIEALGVLIADIILLHDTQEEEYTED